MKIGLQCFDANGNITLDSGADISMRIIGAASTGGVDGSMTINKSANEKVCVFIANAHFTNASGAAMAGWCSPIYEISDNGTTAVISWKYIFVWDGFDGDAFSKFKLPQDFLYGVYVI